MGVIRYRHGRRPSAIAALCLVTGVGVLVATPELRDAPVVWHENDRQDIAQPRRREPNLTRDAIESSFFRPMGRLFNPARVVRHVGSLFGGDHVPPAENVNSLDEVPNSSWFTNRIGLFPITREDAARGPMTGSGPDRSGTWTVVGAKTEGITPGFTIRDARGDRYMVKFDPPGYVGMTIGASVISGRILHAAGYNVTEDFVVSFRREDLVVGDDVEIDLADGTSRTMAEGDLEEILESVEASPNGSWRAVASKFLTGIDSGPFDWRGTRDDDPNDRIDHEDRRELRAFRIFSAWLCHFDTKQGNTLDMYVEEHGRRFLRHYVIDFASTLGAGAQGPFPTACNEYSIDIAAIFGRALTLGFKEDPWRRIERPDGLDEVGFFESEIFEPRGFKPLKPNAAFANLTDRDGYWAAKIISAFSDAHIEAIVAEGRYTNTEATRWIARVLTARRDKISRYFFDRIPPLDFFVNDDGVIRFHDLGVERGIYPGSSARYRIRLSATTAERKRGRWTQWLDLTDTSVNLERASGHEEISSVPVSESPFLALEVQVNRISSWSPATTVYVARGSGRVVAVDR
jgi:hypothetical protein